MFTTLLNAILFAGIPLLGISYGIFYLAFSARTLDPTLGKKELDASFKTIKKSMKADKSEKKKQDRHRRRMERIDRLNDSLSEDTNPATSVDNGQKKQKARNWTIDSQEAQKKGQGFIISKWMGFGGGFYGLVAVYTFFLIEVAEIFDFFANFTSIADFIARIGIGMIIDFIINSIMNFLKALLWFLTWIQYLDSFEVFLAYLITGYIGYRVGFSSARKQFLAVTGSADITLDATE